MIPERSLAVLRAIVEHYVRTREPVGSQSLAARHDFGVSAATIRNDMALLEEEELIAAPHTSAGRIPTEKGYRAFVDQLSNTTPVSSVQRSAISIFLDEADNLEDLLGRTVRMVAHLTDQLAVVEVPAPAARAIQHIEFVPISEYRMIVVVVDNAGEALRLSFEVSHPLTTRELADLRETVNRLAVGVPPVEAAERIFGVTGNTTRPAAAPASLPTVPEHAGLAQVLAAFASALAGAVDANERGHILVAGTANLVRGEQDFPKSIGQVLDAIEEQVVILRLFREMTNDEHAVMVRIGNENEAVGLTETAVVLAQYGVTGHESAGLGVVGPTRMNYGRNIAAVRAVARYLSQRLE